MRDPEWLAQHRWEVHHCGVGGDVAFIVADKLLAHVDELRSALSDVLQGYTELAIELDRPEIPRAHMEASLLLYRDSAPKEDSSEA